MRGWSGLEILLRAAALSQGWLCGLALLSLTGCGSLLRNDNAEGVALYQQGNYQGAITHFQQALAQQPGSSDCFYNLGATYHQQAKLFARPVDMQTAEQYYHLCLARNPNHEACERGLAVLMVEQKRPAEAIALLQSWAERQPTNPNPQIELARLCEEHGDLRDAENHLMDALAIDPNNTRALVALGQIRESAGESALALANYSRAISIDPKQPAVSARVIALNTAAQANASRLAALPPPVLPPVNGSTPLPAAVSAAIENTGR
ncbi:MAG: tetratricopeptide repeat protein [Planctomycetia bacterium]|nr:tetratricopeptide repeat protein [Planctomycetia bacterium]RLT13919.1 MAG: tetratricopeptide repeat protein [Planctomycetota bacterium]